MIENLIFKLEEYWKKEIEKKLSVQLYSFILKIKSVNKSIKTLKNK